MGRVCRRQKGLEAFGEICGSKTPGDADADGSSKGTGKLLGRRGNPKIGGIEAVLINDSMRAFCTPGLVSALDSTLLKGITIPPAGK